MKKLIPDENNWKNKLSKFFNNKGFYIVLAVCIIAVAATAIFVTTQNMKAPGTDDKIISGDANIDQGDEAKTVTGSVSKNEASKDSTASNAQGKTASNPSTSAKGASSKASTTAMKFERPVNGSIMKDFTRDINTFSESKTLGDFRAHKGIDFKVDKLTKVRAVADGTICLVEDSLDGITVEISHGTGLVTKYAGLSKQDLENISYGMKVKANDIIGLVGDPIQSECEDGPHLHFEVLKNGKSVDPSAYLKASSTAKTAK